MLLPPYLLTNTKFVHSINYDHST